MQASVRIPVLLSPPLGLLALSWCLESSSEAIHFVADLRKHHVAFRGHFGGRILGGILGGWPDGGRQFWGGTLFGSDA